MGEEQPVLDYASPEKVPWRLPLAVRIISGLIAVPVTVLAGAVVAGAVMDVAMGIWGNLYAVPLFLLPAIGLWRLAGMRLRR